MRISILAVGKIKELAVRTTVDDYYARIRRYVPFDEIELREGRGDEVADQLARRLPAGGQRIALDVLGEELTSSELAHRVGLWGGLGKGQISFLIGGADGLSTAILSGASFRLSLSRLTLPHRLARLFLAEQLYRSMTILRGEPYAR